MKLAIKILLATLVSFLVLIMLNITKAVDVEITTETLNLRKEPSTESDIVAQISIGEECELLEEEEDWYRVKYGEYTGYISKEYARVVGEETQDNNSEGNSETQTNPEDNNDEESMNQENTDNNVVDENNAAEGNNQNAQAKTAKTNKSTAIRITPLINSSILDTLKNNTEVTIVNEINGWSYVYTDEISGWVRNENIDVAETTTTSAKEPSNSEPASETKEPSEPDDTSKPDEPSDTTTSDFTPKDMYTIDVVNIRQEPSTTAKVIMVLATNTSLRVVGETGDWYEVETSEGNAYVSKELLSDEQVEVTNRGNIDRNAESEANIEESKTEDDNSTENNSSEKTETASSTAEEIVKYAKQFLGVPYVYGGASPSGFDCSGFTMYVFDKFGISMRHGAQAQAKLGEEIKADKSSKTSLLKNLEIGDLVFFLDYETMDEIGHCGIYIGNGDFIHASSGSGYCVKINSLLPGEYYNTRYCAARRVL